MFETHTALADAAMAPPRAAVLLTQDVPVYRSTPDDEVAHTSVSLRATTSFRVQLD
jgi:hypothetical protein